LSISFADATATLLKGSPQPWSKFQDHKAGSISLGTSGQRRLFEFLLKQPAAKVVIADASLFDGLIVAWNGTSDPALSDEQSASGCSAGTWRLVRLEASGFGGLTIYGGPTFDQWIGGENWCLEGQNGSGKSSFTNAILWALTGKRVREQDGLVDDNGQRAPVYNEAGKQIGVWPPLVSYPEKASELIKDAEVWVRLTFENMSGDTATAFRKIISPHEGDPSTEVVVDPRLVAIPQLIETGLLMPARIPRIGFGNKSQSLYEAVKLLTGLDQLADIAEAARLIGHRAQPFLKYAKQQGADQLETSFAEAIARAEAKSQALDIDLAPCRTLGQKDVGATLAAHSKTAAARAAEYLATLKFEIASHLDVAQADARAKIKDAVGNARAILNLGVKTIPEFQAWAALKAAKDGEQFTSVPDLVSSAKSELEAALLWHKRQGEDQRLRLKALAASYYVTPEEGRIGVCPLCFAELTSKQQVSLQAELAYLKVHAAAAERRLTDVCTSLEKQLGNAIPAEMRPHHAMLADMDPKEAYASAALLRFAQEEPFKSTLVGIATIVTDTVAKQTETLPPFEYSAFVCPSVDAPAVAVAVLRNLHSLERLVALVEWWSGNGQAFRDAWVELVQQKDEHGSFYARTVAGQLATLEQAVDKAEPLDELSANLAAAAKAADAWDEIQKHQAVRESIAGALEPLKDLRFLVNAETAASIAGLSKRIKEVLAKIHLHERLNYEDASLQKKEVAVAGSFDPGIRIDAALVANTSWLRAILWAFVLALRGQTIEALGGNPLPLVVMDDPQTTFDPRNKRKWAQVLAAFANADHTDKDATQLILTTHEQQFFKFLVDEQKLTGQQGLIAAVNKATRVATIANGSSLVRTYDAAIAANDDELGHKYVSDVRIYCEDLLKCIMRAESPAIPNMNLDSLKRELAKLRESSVAPFNRKAFTDLSDTLSGGGGAEMNLINASHHQYDGTIGVAQAEDVRQFWDKTLQKQLHQAFQVYSQFEAFSGDPRVFTWEDTIVAFPTSHRDAIKKFMLKNTGVAAAAQTDGRAGDGALTIKEWETAEPITLSNHDIYRLSAGTLDPVAAIGDLLIVCNHAPVTRHSLVVAAFGDRLLARRYNESDSHPNIAILTGQTLEPHELPQPIIAPKEKMTARKIVGTMFTARTALPPAKVEDREVEALPDIALAQKMLNNARLFKVEGRSAEPIALDTQFLITHPTTFSMETVKRLDQHLVVAVDANGARYFKRLQVRQPFAILESLNPDGTTAAELLSLDDSGPFPRLTGLLEVVGILFELPDGAKKKN
jgi:AAA domain